MDVIVNNAGALEVLPVNDFDLEAFCVNNDANLLAEHGLLAAALPHLEKGALVVDASSVNAALPPEGAALFGASKAALELWTRAMAKELVPSGIRVNAAAPDAANTPRSATRRRVAQCLRLDARPWTPATPQDIAAAVRFLASDAASAITGEILTASGGYRL